MTTIGIDFGTTNCSAAIFRRGRVELIPLEGEYPVLPSTICYTRSGEILFGRAAIQRYLDLTRETPIRYRFADLRALTSVFATEMAENPLIESDHGLVVVSDADDEDDADKPARLFQSIKSALRDAGFNGTTIYGRYYATEELIALVLRHIRERAEAYLGEPVTAAVIGRPVSYAPPDRPASVPAETIDRTAHERMLAAARLAGFERTALEYEPVVVDGIGEGQHDWLPTASSWFQKSDLDVLMAQNGPKQWARSEVEPMPYEMRRLTDWLMEQIGRYEFLDTLPELARIGCRRSLPGRTKPDGGGTDRGARLPRLRQDTSGLSRLSDDDRRFRGSLVAGSPQADRSVRVGRWSTVRSDRPDALDHAQERTVRVDRPRGGDRRRSDLPRSPEASRRVARREPFDRGLR